MLKKIVRAIAPAWLQIRVGAARARRHSHRLNQGWGLTALSEKLLAALGPQVQAGPFMGMRLPRAAAREHLGPYLLGVYERELHRHWLSLTPGTFPVIVNVGAKFGYYAIGLHRLLQAPVVAYDADGWARRVLAEAARLNGADVTIRGACRRGDLEGLPDGALVVIDCEGCEQDLLRDPLPAGLARAHLVVELHGALLDDDDVARRLRRTHLVLAVPTDDTPPPADLPFLSDAEQRLAVQENRSPQRWLLCPPRA